MTALNVHEVGRQADSAIAVSPLAAALALREQIRERSAAMEAAERVDADVMAALVAAGVCKMVTPAEASGLDLHPTEVIDTLAALSYADGSTGWVSLATNAATGVAGTYLPDAAIEQIFHSADPAAHVCAGTLQPRGKAEAVDGGYRLSGVFAFGSGSVHANWMLAGFRLYEQGAPVRRPDGAPRVLMAVVRRDRVELRGNWDVMGLRATASYDYEVLDHVAPAEFVRDTTDLRAVRGEGLRRLGPETVGTVGHGAWPLGVAERALDELTALVRVKQETPPATGLLADRRTIRRDVGEAHAQVRAARVYLCDAYERLWESNDGSPVLRAQCRLAATNAVSVGVRVTHMAYLTAGTTALRNDSVIQRCFRDMHGGSQHRLTAEPTWVEAAEVVMGLDDAYLKP